MVCRRCGWAAAAGVVSTVLLLAATACAQPAHSPPPFAVIGYLPEYRFYIDLNQAMASLTHLVVFSIEPNADGSLQVSRITPPMIHSVQTAPNRASTKVSVCVGGAGRSQHFAKATANAKARKRLVSELVRFVDQLKFDGLDLDWEAPTDVTQMATYVQLLLELRAEFDKHEGWELSVALHPGQGLGRQGFDAVHRVHLMTYDDFQNKLGHSTLGMSKQAVLRLMDMGLEDASKIAMGVPAYARSLSNPNEVLTYAEIVDKHSPSPDTDRVGDFAFNGLATLREKVAWAKGEGLGGVMVWEVGQDKLDSERFSLVRALHRAASGASAAAEGGGLALRDVVVLAVVGLLLSVGAGVRLGRRAPARQGGGAPAQARRAEQKRGRKSKAK